VKKRVTAAILLSRASAAPASTRVSSRPAFRAHPHRLPGPEIGEIDLSRFSRRLKKAKRRAECGKAGASSEIGPTSRSRGWPPTRRRRHDIGVTVESIARLGKCHARRCDHLGFRQRR